MSLTRYDLMLCDDCGEPLWVHHTENADYDGHAFIESGSYEYEQEPDYDRWDRGWSRADLLFGGNW